MLHHRPGKVGWVDAKGDLRSPRGRIIVAPDAKQAARLKSLEQGDSVAVRCRRPLFASYFFAQISSQWRPIATCFGVLCILKTGDYPAKMPDREIEALQAMIVGGFVRLPEGRGAPVKRKIAIGSKVRITAGPFSGMSGLYAGQSTRDREKILLSLLGGQRPVLIAADLVAPA
jgi:transcription antitermination factor NusG